MRVTKELGCIWYDGDGEHAGLKACVSRNNGGYSVHAMWERDGKSWIGGYGEGSPIPLDEATELAKKFVTGVPVPGQLGGYADNGSPAQCKEEDDYASSKS